MEENESSPRDEIKRTTSYLNDVLLAALRADHDDWDCAEWEVLTNFGAALESVHFGHHHITKNDVWHVCPLFPSFVQYFDRLNSVHGLGNLVLPLSQTEE